MSTAPLQATPTHPVIRVVDASLGPEAHVRLVVSGGVDLPRLRAVWVSSGATVTSVADRLHATTTVSALARAAGRAFGADQGRRFEQILRDAILAWSAAPEAVELSSTSLRTDQRPAVMGIVNVTPDSFSERGELYPGEGRGGHPQAAVDHARRLVEEGADILDIGGESTRPGASPVGQAEELDRVLPVVEQVTRLGAVVSIDTTKAEVARAALAAGAQIVNDVSGARNPDLLAVAAEAGAGYVLMHTRGTPAEMQQLTDYDDVVAEVYEFLAQGLERVTAAGIDPERVLVDPGLGFAKTATHNLQLLQATRQLRSLGRPVVIGASRKSFIGSLLDQAPASERLEGSLACAVLAVADGAAVVRVHDVAPTVRAVRVTQAVVQGDTSWGAADAQP